MQFTGYQQLFKGYYVIHSLIPPLTSIKIQICSLSEPFTKIY